MLPRKPGIPASAPPFLPLAFRFSASFGLLVLHLAIPADTSRPPVGEGSYLLLLALFFLESVWEAAWSLGRGEKAFATPAPGWIRWNVGLDIALVTLMIAFQGVDQERFAVLYIFPVLASAFYLGVREIVAVGLTSAVSHILILLFFLGGILPPFGYSGTSTELQPGDETKVLALSSIVIFAATFVMVMIRRNLEGLTETLRVSRATVEDLSALHRRVVESLFSGLITTDLEGRITSANPAAEAILHRPLTPGVPVRTILDLDPDLQEQHPKDQRFETGYLTPDGHRRLLGGHAAPLRDAEGRQTGHLLLFQDLTEMKTLEERTRLSERLAAVGELSAGLAHELRNPLASIMGCAQLLRQEEQSPLMQERALGILGRETERVSHILTNFLDFTRHRDVELKNLFLPPLMEELRASWETDPRTEGIPFQCGDIPDLWVLGDPLCAHKVFTNLLTNARKAVQKAGGGEVRLRGEVRGNRLEVSVEDTGCGMGPEQLERLFVPFASGFQEGTGLGMRLVYQFTPQTTWDIRVESQEGGGTAVHLDIPVAP